MKALNDSLAISVNGPGVFYSVCTIYIISFAYYYAHIHTHTHMLIPSAAQLSNLGIPVGDHVI